MPHSTVSTRNEHGERTCPYCGYPLKAGQVVCPAHADLVRLEPLDDRYTLSESEART